MHVQRDVGASRILDKTTEADLEATGVTVGDGVDLETKIAKKLGYSARIIGRIAQTWQFQIVRLADDQSHTVQRLR